LFDLTSFKMVRQNWLSIRQFWKRFDSAVVIWQRFSRTLNVQLFNLPLVLCGLLGCQACCKKTRLRFSVWSYKTCGFNSNTFRLSETTIRWETKLCKFQQQGDTCRTDGPIKVWLCGTLVFVLNGIHIK